jgi:hypothetical protein
MTMVANVPLMSSPLAANWSPVSMTLAVNFLNCTTVVVDTDGKLTLVSTKQVHGIFAACVNDTDDYLHKKVNLKEKMYLNVTLTTLRCPNKIIKLGEPWRFFPFATSVNDTGGAL